MTAQVLLLRGVNVGGHGKLPMAELRALLDDLGAAGARSYIQSGNVVCPNAVDVAALADLIEAEFGFRRPIVHFSATEWHATIATNPFHSENPKAVHGFFHGGGALQTDPMQPFLGESEWISSHPRVLWLHAPDGIGRSKFAAKVDHLAGRAITARSLKTITAVTEILRNL